MTSFPVFNQWIPVDGCSSGGSGGDALLPISEALAVTGANALAPLSQTPYPGSFTILVNGRGFSSAGSPPDFSVSGTALTWLSTEYSVSPGDDVIAIYFYVGPV